MKTVKLAENLRISRIVHGLWRLKDWKLSKKETASLIEQCVDFSLTTFDHADIYGDYTCEKLFGAAFYHSNITREKIQLISKCGIKLESNKFPNTKVKHYDYSYEHIVSSAENSLINLKTDYLDLLLLHRPSPFFDLEEVYKAFHHLKKSGKVRHFGVSNFSPQQCTMLSSALDEKLVTNQIEISPLHIESFTNTLDFLMGESIAPMAWSPLAGGRIFNPKTTKEKRVYDCLNTVAQELQTSSIDKIAYAWLLKHPSGIIPIVGSGNIDRIKNAIEALKIELSLEQWFKIYTAALGSDVP